MQYISYAYWCFPIFPVIAPLLLLWLSPGRGAAAVGRGPFCKQREHPEIWPNFLPEGGRANALKRETALTSNLSPSRDGVVKEKIHFQDVNWKTKLTLTRETARKSNFNNGFLKNKSLKIEIHVAWVCINAVIKFDYLPNSWKVCKILVLPKSIKDEIDPKDQKFHTGWYQEKSEYYFKQSLKYFLQRSFFILSTSSGCGDQLSFAFPTNEAGRTQFMDAVITKGR